MLTMSDVGTDEIATAELGALDVQTLHRRFAERPSPELESELLSRYEGLAGHVASRFFHRGEAPEDLRQVALFALVRALRRYDPDRGTQFSTYAVPSILGELRRHFRDRAWLVKPPRRLQEAYLVVRGAVDALEGELGRAPSVGEVATFAAVSETEVVESLAAGLGRNGVSLETPLAAGDELTLEDGLGDDDVYMTAAEDSVLLGQLIGRLPEDQRRVIRLSYFTELPQTDIAGRLGMSQMKVSRLQRQALELLRIYARAGLEAA